MTASSIANLICIGLYATTFWLYIRMLKRNFRIMRMINERMEIEQKLLDDLKKVIDEVEKRKLIHPIQQN